MYVDFTNMNQACLKDYFLVARINQVVEVTVGFPYLGSLSTYLRYHHIFMVPEDEEKITFYNK